MRRSAIVLAFLMSMGAVTSSACAAEVDVRPGPKYSTLVFRAYPGEKNNVNLRGIGQPVWVTEGIAFLWVDLASPVLRSRDIACANGAFSAECLVQYTEAVDIDLADGDDRVDISGNAELPSYVHCGSGYDKVVVDARYAGWFQNVDADCEYVITATS
jgi:hypothetical protein